MRKTLWALLPWAFWLSPVLVWGGLACTKPEPGRPDAATPTAAVSAPASAPRYAQAEVGAPPRDLKVKSFNVHDRWFVLRWHDDEMHVTCWLGVSDKSLGGQSIDCIPDKDLGLKAEKSP